MDSETPLKVHQHPYKGRCFVAARPIKRGERVQQETAFAMIPDSEAKNRICSQCFTWLEADQKKWQCENECGHVVYCSIQCKNLDWHTFHQSECDFMIKTVYQGKRQLDEKVTNRMGVDSYTIDFTWMIMRALKKGILELKTAHRVSPSETIHVAGSFADVWKMCSNSVCFPDDRIRDFLIVTQVLAAYLSTLNVDAETLDKLLPEPLKEEVDFFHQRVQHICSDQLVDSTLYCKLFTLICKEECNSFGIYNFSILGPCYPRQAYGLAVFPLSVFFNHSCSPNICYVTRGKDIIFYANQEIAQGEEVCISYVSLEDQLANRDSLESKEWGDKRRETLKNLFFFDCDCRRCAVETGKITDAHAIQQHRTLMTRMLCQQNGCYGWFAPKQLSKMAVPCGQEHKLARSDSGKKVATTAIVAGDSIDTWICEACNRQTSF